MIKNNISVVLFSIFVYSLSFFLPSAVSASLPCSCNASSSCYPDGCTRKTIKADGNIDYNLCKDAGCGGAYNSCYQATDVENTEIGPYYCVQQPPCCKDMVERNDPEACCWPERGFCHPFFCEKVSRKEQCGWYWTFHSGVSDRSQGYGCMKGSSSSTLKPIFGLPAGVPGAQPTSPPPTCIPPTSVPTRIPTLIPTQRIIPTNQPPLPSQVIPTQVVIPSPTAFTNPIDNLVPQMPQVKSEINLGVVVANSVGQGKAIATQVLVASKPILDIPSQVGTKIITLDQQMESYMNNLLLQIWIQVLKWSSSFPA